MGKKRHRRDRLIRRRPYREPRKRLLVVCGGTVTEPSYFDGVRHKFRDRLISLEVVRDGRAPEAIVQRAIDLNHQENTRATDAFDRFDQVWCVFDKDQFNLDECFRLAGTNGIMLAISNPCFELWLVLHFQDQGGHLTTSQAKQLCQRYLPHYNKHVELDRIWQNLQEAVRRAQALEDLHRRNGQPGSNPSTGIHNLMRQIQQSQMRIKRA